MTTVRGPVGSGLGLSLELLGAPRIWVDSQPLVVDTRKAVALLAYLAVTGRAHERAALARLLWPDADDERARAALRRTLSALGKGLGGRWVAADRSTVRLDEESVALDVAAFLGHLSTARRAPDPDDRLAELTAAVTIARGDFLAGFVLRDSPDFDDWQFFTAESLRRDLASALEELVAGCVDVGDLHAAIAHARRWLALDALHEPAHRSLMLLYQWTGRREAALRQYRECLRSLHRELGVVPLPETNALYEAIKEGRAPVPPPPRASERAAAARAGGSRRALAIAEGAVVGEAARAPAARPDRARVGLPLRLPLVGRDAELAALARAHAEATDGRLAILEGEPGIGKTRLAEQLVADAGAGGASTVAVRCYDGEQRLAYSAVVDLLRAVLPRLPGDAEVPAHWWAEASRLLPELADRAPGRTAARADAPGAPARLIDSLGGLLRAGLAGDPPGVLLIDDAHWLDEACLDLLSHLVHRLEGARVLLVLAWRSELVGKSHRLRGLLADAEAAGRATAIRLGRLPETAVAELVRSAGLTADAGAVARVMAETEGVPLYIVHYLRSLAEDRDDWWAHRDIAALLDARIAAIDETARQLLTAAAVIGRWFDVDTLRAASGRTEEETAAGLERLVARGLVREAPQTVAAPEGAGAGTGRPPTVGGYDFTHWQLRERALAGAGLARRRLLHRRVAAALETHARGRRETPGLRAQIARHLGEAGDEDAAARAYERAGGDAWRVHANAEAISHYEAALALGHPDVGRLHEHLGDLRLLAGEHAAAAHSYETSAALTPVEEVARLEHKLAGVHQRQRAWDLARAHLDAALRHLEAAAPEVRPAEREARVVADRGLVAHAVGDRREARRLVEQALSAAEATGDVAALAQTRTLLGVLAIAAGEADTARAQLQEGRRLAARLEDEGVRAAAAHNLSIAICAAGEPAEAAKLAEEAATLAAQVGDRHREAAALGNLAHVLRALGRPDDAEPHYGRAVDLLGELGVDDPAAIARDRPQLWSLFA